jgi:hypothetical protein
MANKVLENLDTVLDQLIANASALNDEETEGLLKEQEVLLNRLFKVSKLEEKKEELQRSPTLYKILDQKVSCFSALNRQRWKKRKRLIQG